MADAAASGETTGAILGVSGTTDDRTGNGGEDVGRAPPKLETIHAVVMTPPSAAAKATTQLHGKRRSAGVDPLGVGDGGRFLMPGLDAWRGRASSGGAVRCDE